MNPRAEDFPSAGRRLAAAMISYQIGNVGVDRVLRQYRAKPLDSWCEAKAQEILKEMTERSLSVKPRVQTPRL